MENSMKVGLRNIRYDPIKKQRKLKRLDYLFLLLLMVILWFSSVNAGIYVIM